MLEKGGAGDAPEEVPTSGLDEEYSYIDYENSYEFSNREKGSRIVGYAEIINATILIACAFTCIEWPSFCQLPSLRFKLEILIILVRAVLTTSCGVVLIAAANKRSLAHCRVYMLINTFLVTFHYAYVIVAMIIDEVYVFIWPTIEVFPTILFFWTVMEFIKELKYYEKERLNCAFIEEGN
ncbi:hypothetical protein Ocin01_17876 [Orchesella cincta]|uniref:Uncharacterized protein n=1 Tax=Orchesella cincta TaxID=48709 RepID=A0A1D2M763_ORCCI|nr:hypothetical protein Ocin01_17876 [Orchesella cincta]